MSSQELHLRKATPRHRVVVTGIGAVTPLGLSAEESWKNAVAGKSGIATITRFDASGYDCQIVGEVKGFDPDPFVPKKEQKKMDLFIQYAMACTTAALKDSSFEINDSNRDRIGVFVGAGMGGLPIIEKQYDALRDRGPSRVSPFFIPSVITNLASGQISISTGARGPNYSITSACATGAHSIGEAASYISRGLCDTMIAGGAEGVVCPLAIGGFSAMKALSTRNSSPTAASRPFDKDRDGFVLGEGAGVVILERMDWAIKRGAKIYAEVLGYGASSDGYHMTNPSPEGEGAARSMQAALLDAEINFDQIDYVNAHGTSTPVGDELETLAIKRVFKDHSKKIVVSSTKSMTGHLLGAAGAVESIFCLMALHDQVIPPTINLENPSEGCDLDYAPHTARQKKMQYVLNNSFGFGGTNASLIFKKV